MLWLLLGAALAQPLDDPSQEAATLVGKRLPGAVDLEALERAAVQGMASYLDEALGTPGNAVLTTSEHTQVEAWMRGERAGIGVEYAVVAGRGMAVAEVFAGSPGATSGLQPGDLIVGINDHAFTGRSAEQIHQVLQSAAGSTLALDVRRGEQPVRRLEVKRGRYRMPPVRGPEAGGDPVVRISFLGSGTAKALATALDKLGSPDGVVLDLRDTSGGLLEEAVEVAGLFLEPRAIVVQRTGPEGGNEVLRAEGPRRWKGSVVIIVNRGTQGPAEALAASLQHHHRARLVGTPTAGQASQASYLPIGHDLVLQLMDTWLTRPDGRSWAREGVAPDLLVEAPAVTLPPLHRPTDVADLQRQAALRLLEDGP